MRLDEEIITLYAKKHDSLSILDRNLCVDVGEKIF